MKKVFLSVGLMIGIIVLVTSCKKTSAVIDSTQTITLPANGSSVVAANNQFAFNFFRSALQNDTVSDNKLISPLSIYFALSMVYNGANNGTMDSIANVLQLSGISINDLNETCKALLQQLPTEDNEVQLSIANSIWYNKNSFQPLTSFLDTTENFYSAAVQPLDFADQNSVTTINNWIAQHTNNKIQKVLSVISPLDLMYLINAIYFNGIWKSAFDPAKTHNDNFNLQNGSSVSVPFMNQQLSANRYIDSSFSLIELPYGGGKSFSMYLILPNDQQPINNFASQMNQNILTDAISKMYNGNVEVSLPSWQYSYSIDDMKPELSSLGMGIAFGDNADFSKMYNPTQITVKISQAIHKTYIKVNEQGTEAAAVTVIGVTPTDSPPAIPILQFNHPFLYAIIEKQTGSVLFIGTVCDPSQN